LNSQHSSDAVASSTKYRETPWQLQARCKAFVEDAKKKAATELSAPK
jgi:hypothetical protein